MDVFTAGLKHEPDRPYDLNSRGALDGNGPIYDEELIAGSENPLKVMGCRGNPLQKSLYWRPLGVLTASRGLIQCVAELRA
jgi:hypothetical protein